MPQVFGATELGLIVESSLWIEAASASDIEKLTNPTVAAEARARGLVPLRLGKDPIWHHPDSGKIVTLTPAHSGDSPSYNRTVANGVASLKRMFPTEEEQARASRTPEEIEADQQAAANATKTKKQQKADAAKRKREQEEAVLYKKLYAPFKNRGEVQEAFDRRSPDARMVRPRDTVDDFADRLRGMTSGDRLRVHKAFFPEKYRK